MVANFLPRKTLKQDAFGSIELGLFIKSDSTEVLAIKRNYNKHWFFKYMSIFLARNEKIALKKLESLNSPCLPSLLYESKNYHIRSYIPGNSMHLVSDKLSDAYFVQAKKLLRDMRKCGIANNDLAKEANWLITDDGGPAISDFQLATHLNKHRKLLRVLAREDLRHLLKHKKTYLHVSASELNIINKKTLLSNMWRNTGKKIHRFVTRKILLWEDRIGPEERDI